MKSTNFFLFYFKATHVVKAVQELEGPSDGSPHGVDLLDGQVVELGVGSAALDEQLDGRLYLVVPVHLDVAQEAPKLVSVGHRVLHLQDPVGNREHLAARELREVCCGFFLFLDACH